MASNVNISIVDDNIGDECIQYYQVAYNIHGSQSQTVFTIDSPLPTKTINGIANQPYIAITGLQDATSYDYAITRYCCNNVPSLAAQGQFQTA